MTFIIPDDIHHSATAFLTKPAPSELSACQNCFTVNAKNDSVAAKMIVTVQKCKDDKCVHEAIQALPKNNNVAVKCGSVCKPNSKASESGKKNINETESNKNDSIKQEVKNSRNSNPTANPRQSAGLLPVFSSLIESQILRRNFL